MQSLNDIVKFLVEYEWKEVAIESSDCFYVHPVETELRLDYHMPSIYSLTSCPVNNALFELFHEINDHTESTRRRVITKLCRGRQLVELAWNNKPLEEGILSSINQAYQEGMGLGYLPSSSGTRRAGYFLSQVGGNVLIENFSDGVYVARNIITLPSHV